MGTLSEGLGFGPAARRAVFRSVRGMARPQREAQTALAGCMLGARLRGYFMDGVVHADEFLQLSVTSLDYPRLDLPPNIRYVGPVLPLRAGSVDLPDGWPELDGKQPVVLVTQGTLDTMDLDRVIGPTMRALAGEDVLVVAVTGGPPVERLARCLRTFALRRSCPSTCSCPRCQRW